MYFIFRVRCFPRQCHCHDQICLGDEIGGIVINIFRDLVTQKRHDILRRFNKSNFAREIDQHTICYGPSVKFGSFDAEE